MTENIATAYNQVVIVISCDLYNYGTLEPCADPHNPPSDGTVTFTNVERHYNDAEIWTEETWIAVFSTTGSRTITFTPAVTCASCTWKTMVEQVQGIAADDHS
jgi:hypothetical protein